MKNVKLIINPSSGRQAVENKIDNLCKLLLDDGYTVNKFFTRKKNDAMEETISTCKDLFWDLIIVAGGDGTVNEVAKGIVKSERKVPVAILAAGTVNDFANYMKIPSKTSEFYNMIKREKIIDIDLGSVGNEYFVNVAAGGLLANVGYQATVETKALLGRMAYYLEGIRELILKGKEPIKIKIESEEYSGEDEVLMFLISNSSSIGGFKKIAPDADVLDGKLDVIIIKNTDVANIANIFFNILTGEHINHKCVKYFKTEKIKIDSTTAVSVDLDGEYGGQLPGTFKVIPKAMKILV